ncbi:hypothetical protein KUCAC02_030399, partial [Chaenocephalus aceratus]
QQRHVLPRSHPTCQHLQSSCNPFKSISGNPTDMLLVAAERQPPALVSRASASLRGDVG